MAHRVFLDADGVEWQVWAVIPTLLQRELRHKPSDSHAPLGSAMLAGWLAFQADVERRRLVPIPPDWETATIDGLTELLAQAEPVSDRRRLVE